jgi:hypothetical protein
VRTEARLDPCRKLARAISKRALNDASLHKLVSAHPGCRAVLVHSKAPEQTVAVARPVAPRIVSVPAAPATSGTGQSLSVSAGHHDYEEAESERSGDDGGETED